MFIKGWGCGSRMGIFYYKMSEKATPLYFYNWLLVNQMVWLSPLHVLSISLSISLHLYDTNKKEFP